MLLRGRGGAWRISASRSAQAHLSVSLPLSRRGQDEQGIPVFVAIEFKAGVVTPEIHLNRRRSHAQRPGQDLKPPHGKRRLPIAHPAEIRRGPIHADLGAAEVNPQEIEIRPRAFDENGPRARIEASAPGEGPPQSPRTIPRACLEKPSRSVQT